MGHTFLSTDTKGKGLNNCLEVILYGREFYPKITWFTGISDGQKGTSSTT